MKIGIFSKFQMDGGSEFRCAEICSSIAKHTEHEAYLLAESGKISNRIRERLHKDVNLCPSVFIPDPQNVEKLYEMDVILVVNTDSYKYTKKDYWHGKTENHTTKVDLKKIKKMVFLFNFVVSPAQHLHELAKEGIDIRILTTNERFYHEITTKDKHKKVRHFPRGILNSPIDPESVAPFKTTSGKLRLGKHSKSVGNKFNEDHRKLIMKVNKKHGDNIVWDFMGVPGERKKELKDIENVIIRNEFTLSVKDYLIGIDVFLFFIAWKRTEPWARSVAEAMASGCPILGTDKGGGNQEQILNGNNGFLCRSVDDFSDRIDELMDNRRLVNQMGDNSRLYSKAFSSERIIQKFLDFIE